MSLEDLKQLDEAALKQKCVESHKELMGLRFQRATGQVEKTHQFKVLRRNIARAKTLLRQHAKKG